MSIDPTKFEAQGKPKPEQIIAIWDELGQPGYVRVHQELEKRGFQISDRSVARYLKRHREGQSAETLDTVPLNEKYAAGAARSPKLHKELNGALASIPKDQQLQATEITAKGGDLQEEVAIIDARLKELVVMSEAQLDQQEQKSRKILNIMLTEVAARRAHVMVLIPKDTGALVEAMTEASKQTLTGGIDQPPKAGDPRIIDGDVVHVEPDTPLASQISKFLQSEGMTG